MKYLSIFIFIVSINSSVELLPDASKLCCMLNIAHCCHSEVSFSCNE